MANGNQYLEFSKIADIKRVDFIFESLNQNISSAGTVLDVGCGNGVISRFLGSKGYKVHGVDLSEKAIAQARSLNNLPNVTFDVVNAEQLAEQGIQYDAVICSEVLEHLNKPSDLLKNIFSLLRDDGKLVVTVPNGKGPREVLVTKPVQRMQKKNGLIWRLILKMKSTLGYKGTTIQSAADDLTHIQFFSKKDLEKLSSDNNYRIIKFAKCNFIDDVFPFSFFIKRVKTLQKLDSKMADLLPYPFTSGFLSVWVKDEVNR